MRQSSYQLTPTTHPSPLLPSPKFPNFATHTQPRTPCPSLSALSRPLAALVAAQTRNWSRHPRRAQQRIFDELVRNGRMTAFGQDHAFDTIRTYAHFSKQVPVRDYEALRPWLDRVKAAEDHVLWPGKPLYLAKTSGTTSGAKYIPITRASIPNHIESTRNALLNYIHRTGKARFLDGKLIFISGSPALDTTNGILTGRLSGIVNHHVPAYLRRNQLLLRHQHDRGLGNEGRRDRRGDAARRHALHLRYPALGADVLRPPHRPHGQTDQGHLPNFELFVYGGVNYEPYRAKIEQSIGRPVDSIELYPASEGFIAYQDIPGDPGMLLMLNSGIFYEFIPLAEYFSPNPTRLPIWEVQPGVNYAIVLNTNAGLWGYSLGDTVRFVSTDPYRLVVTGRVKHFISAFGEHVIAEEVEKGAGRRLPPRTRRGDRVHGGPAGESARRRTALPRVVHRVRKTAGEPGKIPPRHRREPATTEHLLPRPDRGTHPPTATHPAAGEGYVHHLYAQCGQTGRTKQSARLSNDRALVDGLAKL